LAFDGGTRPRVLHLNRFASGVSAKSAGGQGHSGHHGCELHEISFKVNGRNDQGELKQFGLKPFLHMHGYL
jgi:hypothetical protein